MKHSSLPATVRHLPATAPGRCRAVWITAGVACLLAASSTRAAVVINEFMYDDGGTDDREFVELYNGGAVAVDISGWTVGGRDNGTTNVTTTIPGAVGSGTTFLAPGGYYVIGNTGVPNVNQIGASGIMENDAETLELRSGPFASGALVDAVVYEGNKGPTAGAGTSYGVLPADVAAEVGPTYWGNNAGTDVAGTPLKTQTTLGRYSDGLDTNNNGRDIGLRPSTPGATNTPIGTTAQYLAPNVDAQADLAAVANHNGSFVTARVITPGAVSASNPNAIPAAPYSAKAIIAWDPSGGGNAVVHDAVMTTTGGGFQLSVYLDTEDIPINTNGTGVQFRGSEQSFYGLGSTDSSANLADVSGAVGVGAGVSANGATGVAWYYEKVGKDPTSGAISEKLYLIDAGDGGNGNVAGPGYDWVTLATIDMSGTGSAWHNMGISVDSSGNGTAFFDNQTFAFLTAANLAGSFYASYRENTQDGAVGVPSYLRPPTFAPIPEPSVALLGLLGVLAGLKRRRQ